VQRSSSPTALPDGRDRLSERRLTHGHRQWSYETRELGEEPDDGAWRGRSDASRQESSPPARSSPPSPTVARCRDERPFQQRRLRSRRVMIYEYYTVIRSRVRGTPGAVTSPPYYTLGIGARENYVALGVYVAVLLLVAHVVARLRRARTAASAREAETRKLFELSQLLLGDKPLEALLEVVVRTVCSHFGQLGLACSTRGGTPRRRGRRVGRHRRAPDSARAAVPARPGLSSQDDCMRTSSESEARSPSKGPTFRGGHGPPGSRDCGRRSGTWGYTRCTRSRRLTPRRRRTDRRQRAGDSERSGPAATPGTFHR